ncbi:hypothetical protein HPOKI128_04280 [Helicobacter pylori oki128]|nr:hypothetical protein HPOKI128_04280 [Helicobacter pylori oki128]
MWGEGLVKTLFSLLVSGKLGVKLRFLKSAIL